MNTEEKAKAYDNIIKKANKMHSENCEACQMCIEELIPELKESEDEKIRKELIEFVKSRGGFKQEYIAWLEKQAEQKSIWHNEDEEPQKDSLILLIMQSGTPIVAKIIEPNYTFNHGERWAYIDDLLDKQGEQKPAWSEEDEIALGDALWAIQQAIKVAKDENDIGTIWCAKRWLESLKDKVQPQPKQEWNEEDEDILNTIINHFKVDIECTDDDDIIKWLKSFKDRVQPQHKQKWSEEDDMIRNNIIEYINSSDIDKMAQDSWISWLKNIPIKERKGCINYDYVNKCCAAGGKPQPQWKPSDEQIKVCKEVYADILSAKGFDLGTVLSELNRLEEELKKLKG